MKEPIISIIETILGYIVIIITIIVIRNIIKKKELEEQIRTQKLQEYYKQKEKNKIDPNLLKHIEKISYKNEKNSYYKVNENIFTNTEKFFYKVLKDITEKMNLIIFTKVRLADIIYSPKFNYKDFNKIKAKHIDFVLTDKEGNIKLLIELDDKSHEEEKRKERDNFLNNIFKNQKIKLLRIQAKYSYNIIELENTIKESL